MESNQDNWKTTLLPYGGDLTNNGGEMGGFPVASEGLRRMNVIMKLNNEQIFSLLSAYASEKVQIRAVVKNGKVIGLRKVSQEINDKKVEIVKCNAVKESIGHIYHPIKEKSCAVNMGPLDYRLNFINYKPSVTEPDIDNVKAFWERIRLIEAVASLAQGDDDKCTNVGVKYNLADVLRAVDGKIGSSLAEEQLKALAPKGNEDQHIVAWNWLKLVKSFDSPRWMKRLYIEGYRPNDPYTMLYTGCIDKELLRDKETEPEPEPEPERELDIEIIPVKEPKKEKVKEKKTKVESIDEIAVYSDSGSPSPIDKRQVGSEKSSVSSLTSTFSGSNSESSGSRNTTPEEKERDQRQEKEVKEKEKEKVVNEIHSKEPIAMKKRSFKEYQLSKGLQRSVSVASPMGTPPSLSPAPVKSATAPLAAEVATEQKRETPASTGSKRSLKSTGMSPSKDDVGEPVRKMARCTKKTPTDATALVSEYKSKYAQYRSLYEKLCQWQKDKDKGKDTTLKKVNSGIAQVVRFHNELVSIGDQLQAMAIAREGKRS
jgi:hypothetical protein